MPGKQKKTPLRLAELRKMRAAGGMPCPGKLKWVMAMGMLKPTGVGREYTYTCPNCRDAGNAEYREKCGKILQ